MRDFALDLAKERAKPILLLLVGGGAVGGLAGLCGSRGAGAVGTVSAIGLDGLDLLQQLGLDRLLLFDGLGVGGGLGALAGRLDGVLDLGGYGGGDFVRLGLAR